MKFFMAILLVVVGISANATSLITGPYFYKQIGAPGSDAKWATCTVVPGSVTIQDGSGSTVTFPVSLNASDLEATIQDAKKTPVKVLALHSRATNPAIEIGAGVYPQLKQYLLYRDASDVRGRENVSAEKLVDTANKLCATMVAK